MLQTVGLHPLAAVVVVGVDTMLFGGTVVTAGVGWAASLPVGCALCVGVALLQRNGFSDSWGLAVGKGIVAGLLTAIPTPLPSALIAGGGAAGAARLLLNRRNG